MVHCGSGAGSASTTTGRGKPTSRSWRPWSGCVGDLEARTWWRSCAQQAPTWLVQMPGLVQPADLEALRRRVLGATQERMLRELAEALNVLTAAAAAGAGARRPALE